MASTANCNEGSSRKRCTAGQKRFPPKGNRSPSCESNIHCFSCMQCECGPFGKSVKSHTSMEISVHTILVLQVACPRNDEAIYRAARQTDRQAEVPNSNASFSDALLNQPAPSSSSSSASSVRLGLGAIVKTEPQHVGNVRFRATIEQRE